MPWSVVQSDCLEWLRSLPADSCELVFGSPPYEQARLYLENGVNLGVSRKTDAWVQWMADVHVEAQRACRGLVAFVVAGQTRKFRWSAGPVLYMAELHKRGLNLRNPPIFHRVGIPGSGGPDWLRSDYEWIVCTSRPGRLPWSDNTAMGHAPKWAPGGEMSHRLGDGRRRNQWGGACKASGNRKADGTRDRRDRPSHVETSNRKAKAGYATSGHKDGDTPNGQGYDPPSLANPGNIIKCIVGGGVMGGDKYASQNEAPFPEKLAEFFILSFCPPGGLVCDPFSGSGTTGAVSVRHGRDFMGCDLRQSQVKIATQRISEETPLALFERSNP